MTGTNTEVPALKRRRQMAREPETDTPVGPNDSLSEKGEKAATKSSLVLDLLRRAEGASLDELVIATGWLPHTARAALTALRKKGHAIDKQKVDSVTRYTIAAVAAQ